MNTLLPKLSIITINLDNLEGLKKTMQSVFEQTFTDYEYIIIDGGSKDGSKEYIEEHVGKITYWVSEKDDGIYNAMNKGIQESIGQYLQFLNSGDTLVDDTILQRIFDQNITDDIVYGHFVDIETQRAYYLPSKLSFRFFYKQSINHQACFLKRHLFSKNGLYDEGTSIIADWEFLIKCIFMRNATIGFKNEIIIAFDFKNSISNQQKMEPIIQKERERILKRYFPLIEPDMQYIEQLENSRTFALIKKITRIKKILKG